VGFLQRKGLGEKEQGQERRHRIWLRYFAYLGDVLIDESRRYPFATLHCYTYPILFVLRGGDG
jgi:hypothetical protein